MDYREFLETKKKIDLPNGLTEIPELNDRLFDFQKEIVKWALRRGRAAIFADCGLGKTIMQLEWAHQIIEQRGGAALILAPLAVAEQTIEEGAKFGIPVRHVIGHRDVDDKGINIANYEILHHFSQADWTALVLDESSILKSHSGEYRKRLTDYARNIPYRLACTATPAPNDHMELGTHAEFLGVMKREEMLAMFFTHDGGETSKWRLKGHARDIFWKWLASWAIAIRMPSDIGFSDDDFNLPPLNVIDHVTEAKVEGYLFPVEVGGLLERRQARRSSLEDRIKRAVNLYNMRPDEQWLIWCDLNIESEMLTKAIPGAVEVKGADSNEHKEKSLMGFSHGTVKVLVSKPSIAGWGMNWQNCNNVIFVGVSDSFESYYQAVRRCWRFGQKNPVNVHIIYSEVEGNVRQNVLDKQVKYNEMMEELATNMMTLTQETLKETDYSYREEKGDGWELRLGDCVEQIKTVESDSIGYSIFSPPFASLYTYTDSIRDMGNCEDSNEFMQHFRFLVEELYRVLQPGRLVSFHCMNLPSSKQTHGEIGIRDFRGDLIYVFRQCGFIYHSEVCIWKDPVTAMQRTKALGLLHKQLKKDACMSRQGIADYLVTMRKPGVNPNPVTNTDESFPVSVWQNYASPVWMDINPSKTLQYRAARNGNDERHICPLQLDVIERGLDLWTKEDDLVLSPFAGIGSEGYVAVKMGRRFIGFELKPSYFDLAVSNLKHAGHERDVNQHGLFADAL